MDEWYKFFKLAFAVSSLYETRTIPKYPRYSIDRLGNVYDSNGDSVKIYHYNDDEHYDSVYLKDDNGKPHVVGIHVLISMTFDPEYYSGCIVHHINEDKYDNVDTNLEVTDRSTHGYMHHHNDKYKDIKMKCEVCGRQFIWTADRQMRYYNDLKRGRNRIITCSKSCAGYYARLKQLGEI